MGPLIALVSIVVLALLVVRIGSNALILTGVSKSAANFQAASAFFGVGFTTAEAETVVNHPVRRRIILHLIVSGNVGLTSAAATLIISFVQGSHHGTGQLFFWLFLLAIGVLAIGLAFRFPIIAGPFDKLLKLSLEKAGIKRAVDFETLLNLQDGYTVGDFEMKSTHPWIGMRLMEARPSDAGVVVLSIEHPDGQFIGAPMKEEAFQEGDKVTVYGSESAVRCALEALV